MKNIPSGGAPNYYPNSFSGPLDHPMYALSKTFVVSYISVGVWGCVVSNLLKSRYCTCIVSSILLVGVD